MIKTSAPIMQVSFQDSEVNVSEERRAFLARKGQLLYGKYCGTKGHGICAESFAEYHVWRGELIIVRDLLAYLYTQRESLWQTTQPDRETTDLLAMTDQLIERIEVLIGEPESESLLACRA
jgi:hypothetical protein